jgi:hypothetical protein
MNDPAATLRRVRIKPPRIRNPQRDLAVECVREALYGEMYVGAVGRRDYLRGSRPAIEEGPDDLPKKFTLASAFAKSRQRWRTFVRQTANVIRWLERQHHLDMSPEGFDPVKFEAFRKKHIPARRMTAQARRKRAVAEVLKMKRPGRGRDCTWKEFRRLVEQHAGKGLKFTLKTLQRDVEEAAETRSDI